MPVPSRSRLDGVPKVWRCRLEEKQDSGRWDPFVVGDGPPVGWISSAVIAAKFVHVWCRSDERWLLARVISYGHQTIEPETVPDGD